MSTKEIPPLAYDSKVHILGTGSGNCPNETSVSVFGSWHCENGRNLSRLPSAKLIGSTDMDLRLGTVLGRHKLHKPRISLKFAIFSDELTVPPPNVASVVVP